MSTHSPSLFSRLLVRLPLVLVSFGIAFGVAEILSRWLWRETTYLFPRYHAAGDYGKWRLRRLRPNTVFWHRSIDGAWRFSTNAQGFRDTRNYAHEKPQGVFRVLCLGDSITEGFEVRQDHTYSAVLERALRQRGVNAEVMNCGVSGFSTAEELAFLEGEGVNYRPDVVVLGFYGNDLEDNSKAGLFRLVDGKLVINKTEHQPGVKIMEAINRFGVIRWLSENSYFYSVLFNRGYDIYKARLAASSADSSVELAVQKRETDTETAVAQRELAAKIVARMHEVCRANDARLAILEVPNQTAPVNFPDDDFVDSVPSDLAPTFADESEFFVRCADVFGKYRHVTDIYVSNGQHHPNETAHLLMGMALADALAPLPAPVLVAPQSR